MENIINAIPFAKSNSLKNLQVFHDNFRNLSGIEITDVRTAHIPANTVIKDYNIWTWDIPLDLTLFVGKQHGKIWKGLVVTSDNVYHKRVSNAYESGHSWRGADYDDAKDLDMIEFILPNMTLCDAALAVNRFHPASKEYSVETIKSLHGCPFGTTIGEYFRKYYKPSYASWKYGENGGYVDNVHKLCDCLEKLLHCADARIAGVELIPDRKKFEKFVSEKLTVEDLSYTAHNGIVNLLFIKNYSGFRHYEFDETDFYGETSDRLGKNINGSFVENPMFLKDFDSLKRKLRAFKVLVPDADQKAEYERVANNQSILDRQKKDAAQKDLLAINVAKMPREHLEQIVKCLFVRTDSVVKAVTIGKKTFYYDHKTAERLKKSELPKNPAVLYC